MDEELRLPDANAERINIPANPHHYWRYRMHINIEELMNNQSFMLNIWDMLRESVAGLEDIRVAALGKSGSISGLLKGMGAMSPDERRERGPVINGLRDRVSSALSARKAELEAAELDARLRLTLYLRATP